MSAWMSRSFVRIFGPVLYHPTIFSLAVNNRGWARQSRGWAVRDGQRGARAGGRAGGSRRVAAPIARRRRRF
eukprot:31210-Pelagococcus_subviridis.AAC.9